MLNLSALSQQVLLPGTKGLALTQALPLGQIKEQAYNVLDGDTSFPIAVLKQSALQHNIAWMKQFCAQKNVLLAPHGKTTMSPQLFDMQLRNGAWGITLATVNQTLIAHRFGVKRVLLANQLVNPSDIKALLHILKSDSTFEFFALVDSLDAMQSLAQLVQESGVQKPVALLVELGFQGGRTGCRDIASALSLARAIHQHPCLQLAGIEGYEGLLTSQSDTHNVQQVTQFLHDLISLTKQVDEEGLFEAEQIILSAGGSAYFDLVANVFLEKSTYSRPLISILRSGCYLTHDHGFYQKIVQKMSARENSINNSIIKNSHLIPALEVWSMVQSRPEPDLAILTMGKRDASYDMELPKPLFTHRPGNQGAPIALELGCTIEKMNDQHAYLRLPKNSSLCQSLQVGDLIACGISHPCTTFDKWPVVFIVDDDYLIQEAITTFF